MFEVLAVSKTYRLVVLTRYPEPGRTKTRLIPRLGSEGAAQLQRHLTEHTLTIVQQLVTLCQQHEIRLEVEIWFTGGSHSLMRAWLGEPWTYVEQGEGGLGDRLERAFQSSKSAGITRTVAIGIDCPGITVRVLWESFTKLGDHDLVIGPATDGGYYLIGMTQVIPDLFRSIAWSTDQVLTQTLAIARSCNLLVALLEPLPDIDRPEDLWVWDQIQAATPTSPSDHDSVSLYHSPNAQRSRSD